MPQNKSNSVIIVLFILLGLGLTMMGSYIIGMAVAPPSEENSPASKITGSMGEGSKVILHAADSSTKKTIPLITEQEMPQEESGFQPFQYEEAIPSERSVQMSIKEQIIEYPEDMMKGDGQEHYLPVPETSITTGGGLTENPLAKEKDKKAKKEGTPPWLANAVSIPFDHSKPMVAIVIDDMGVDVFHTNKVMEIEAPLTLAFLPYAPNVRQQAEDARKKGYELLIHVPMEPQNLAGNNPGPGALLLKQTQAENLGRLKAYMAQMEGYVGINNHMGSAYTGSTKAMMPVFNELAERGLMFLDSRTTGRSVGDKLADLTGIPFVKRDVFLDHDASLEGVENSLKKVEKVALKYGSAIAIGHPKDNTIKALLKWIPLAKEKGIQIVPLTTITRHRMKADPIGQNMSEARQQTEDKMLMTALRQQLAPEIASGHVRLDVVE